MKGVKNVLRAKGSSKVKYEAFFFIFKVLLVARNYLRPESGPLNGTHVALKIY